MKKRTICTTLQVLFTIIFFFGLFALIPLLSRGFLIYLIVNVFWISFFILIIYKTSKKFKMKISLKLSEKENKIISILFALYFLIYGIPLLMSLSSSLNLTNILSVILSLIIGGMIILWLITKNMKYKKNITKIVFIYRIIMIFVIQIIIIFSGLPFKYIIFLEILVIGILIHAYKAWKEKHIW